LPEPKAFSCFMPMVSATRSAVEKPKPSEMLPVGFSTTETFKSTWSLTPGISAVSIFTPVK
jgi:hypothetical protein